MKPLPFCAVAVLGALFGLAMQHLLPIGGRDVPANVEVPVTVEVPATVEDLYYESFRIQDYRTLAVIVDRRTGARTLLVEGFRGLALAPLPKIPAP